MNIFESYGERVAFISKQTNKSKTMKLQKHRELRANAWLN